MDCIGSAVFAGALQLDGFVASDKWVQRWKKRHGISTRRSTSISQKVPGDFRDLLFNYRRAALLLRRQHDYPLNCVMNMDQTMLRFDMLPQRTSAKKGCRQVRTKTTRVEKRGFTVALFVAADGTNVPAMIVFKERNGQIPPRVYQQLQVPDNVRVHATRNGWMTREALMVWIRQILGRADGRRLLALDSYPAHRTQEVREALLERNVDAVYIPGGCTALAQPVDVSIAKPFKDAVRDTWVTWMREDRPLTAAGNLRQPTRQDVLSWVGRAWHSVRPDIIVTAFKRCTISNAMDGSEDDQALEWFPENIVAHLRTANDAPGYQEEEEEEGDADREEEGEDVFGFDE